MKRTDLKRYVKKTLAVYKGDPLKEGDKRERILAAAIDLMSQYGYRKTSVDEIAEKAGVAKGTVYIYFRDKRDLLLSVIRGRVASLLGVVIDEALDEPDVPSMMRKALRIVIDFHVNDEVGNTIFTREAAMMAAIIAGNENPVEEVVIGFLENLLKLGVAEGSLSRRLDIQMTARAIATLMRDIVFRIKTGEKVDYERKLESTLDIVLNGIIHWSAKK